VRKGNKRRGVGTNILLKPRPRKSVPGEKRRKYRKGKYRSLLTQCIGKTNRSGCHSLYAWKKTKKKVRGGEGRKKKNKRTLDSTPGDKEHSASP